MRALYFKLWGNTAIFKKPEVNSYAYFTYNNIHKVALLGMIGSVIGLGGYSKQYDDSEGFKKNVGYDYPEFYERLQNIKVAIIPESKIGVFTKKIQTFNNSVGYASQEEGGNLVVREQWLENPIWHVYIQLDGYKGKEIEKKLLDKIECYFLDKKCEYIPYLGKNDHYASISNCRVLRLDSMDKTNHIDSLFPLEEVELGNRTFDNRNRFFLFKEIAPFSLNKEYNFYEYKEMCMTDLVIIDHSEDIDIFSINEKIVSFY